MICDKCYAFMVLIHGHGWDYDNWYCPRCHHTIELEESTFPTETVPLKKEDNVHTRKTNNDKAGR